MFEHNVEDVIQYLRYGVLIFFNYYTIIIFIKLPSNFI